MKPENETHTLDSPPEEDESLWILVVAPAIWAGHFLASYLTGALWCAKVVGRDGSLEGARLLVALYTVAALAGIGFVARIAFRRHDRGTTTVPHDFDSADDRHRFLGFATLLLSGMSAVGTLYVALVVAFVGSCR